MKRRRIMRKSIFKKLLCVAASAVMLFSAAACSNAGGSSSKDESLKKVKDAGKIILGLDATFKPMGFTDENDQIVGFDIDVAKEVCKRMGVSLELYAVNWDTKEQDLNAGTIDLIWNGLSVSDERKQVMLMSEP
ncbi:MAG: transporter substrate-binding domain-containing protein, partial [Oscillospiraceae bacterium]|nr:transporter substrate-binding domain-containing protein [Oscillospiraceae bacterium]